MYPSHLHNSNYSANIKSISAGINRRGKGKGLENCHSLSAEMSKAYWERSLVYTSKQYSGAVQPNKVI